MNGEKPTGGEGQGLAHRTDSEARLRLAILSKQIDRLEETFRRTLDRYDGMIDLPTAYSLAERQLEAVIEVLTLSLATTDERADAKKFARGALSLIDRLSTASLSVDQKNIIRDSKRMERIGALLAEVIYLDGGPLFDAEGAFANDAREIAELLRSAIARHCHREEEYDVDPGDEEVMESERMILPRSQAVHLITRELIPALQKRLSADPGNPDIQRRIRVLSETADAFETLKYFPQARPPSFEKDIFTAALAGFTTNNEPLVTVEVPVLKSTENRMDRLRDMIKTEIITAIAGKGLHKETDSSLSHIKRTDSGNRGSWGNSLQKLDTQELYRSLSMSYPFLKRIEDEKELILLADLASRGETKQLSSRIHSLMIQERNYLMAHKEIESIPDKADAVPEPPIDVS